MATVYAQWTGGALPAGYSVTPLRWMVSFGRTGDLRPGGSVELDLSFPCEELKMVNDAGDEVVLAGSFAVVLAGSFAVTVFDGTTTLPPFAVAISASKTISVLPPPPGAHPTAVLGIDWGKAAAIS